MKTPQSPKSRTKLSRHVEAVSFSQLAPNLLTTIGLCGGLVGIHYALSGHFRSACLALLVSFFCDGLDGRVARILRASSKFGAEYDSLTDFMAFGVAPALIVFLWSVHNHDSLNFAFIPSLLYAVCMALRLARFNVAEEAPKGAEEYTRHFFSGVPAPAGAGLALFPIFLGLAAQQSGIDWLIPYTHGELLCASSLVITAFLLVCTLPIWSIKHFRVPKHFFLPFLLIAAIYIAFFVATPWATLAMMGIVYILLIPTSHYFYWKWRRLQEKEEGEELVANL
ncbi:phosphatidylcholine/phosphatidylserine synthase [Acetobacteraceae bacterium]|nr:phosphatidylcholine/phosphatidylserine synthase [Acetobacteraceae bacterium]